MDLAPLFNPRSVAVFGARPEPARVGYALMRNLLDGAKRTIYPITSEFSEVLGVPAFATLAEVPDPVDLALIAIKADDVPVALRACAAKGVKHVVIISAGFKEAGEHGAALESEIAEIAREHGIALLGPNCLGVLDTASDLNASFVAHKPLPGAIGVLSQSGAIGTSFLDWAAGSGVGVSKFLSLGNEAGLSEIATLEYLGNDASTRAILLYLEHVSDGARFLELLRSITPRKPVVVLRAGRSARGSAAVMSHTGSLAPEDAIFTAALKQAGAIPVASLRELFDIAKLFALGIVAPLPRIAIVTNGGGPSVNAADLVELSGTLSLALFDDDTKAKLRAALPSMAAVGNPVDVIGDAGAKRYQDALDILSVREDIDAIVAIVTPQMMTDAPAIAEVLIAMHAKKPILPVFMGGAAFREGIAKLAQSGMVNFDLAPDAIAALAALAKSARRSDQPEKSTRAFASSVMLGYDETADLLARYGIPIFGTFVRAKEDIPSIWPGLGAETIAMKAISRDVVHKTDANAVRLNIASADDAMHVWDEIALGIREKTPEATIEGMLLQPMVRGKETIVGMKRDATFGPVVVFGLGGIFVEVLKDVSMRVAPISEGEAEAMLDEIAGARYLGAFRGAKPVDRHALAAIIANLSRLAAEHPEILEIDLNPVIATPDRAYVVDARLMAGGR